jgi:hypothetical protein
MLSPHLCVWLLAALFRSVRSMQTTRARFLSSSSATAFLLSSVVANAQECSARSLFDGGILDSSKKNINPRYIDKELQMKYGDGPGMCNDTEQSCTSPLAAAL